MSKKVVVFDAFNTLVKRNKKYVTEPYKLISERATKPLFNPMGENLSLIGWARSIGAEFTEDEWKGLNDGLAKELAHITLFEETINVLKIVREQGYYIAVASNLAYEYGPAVRALLHQYVDEFFFSYEMRLVKPESHFYNEIMETMEEKYRVALEPTNYFMTGDSLVNDYEKPKSLGWKAMHLDRKGKVPFSISRLNSIFIELNNWK